MRYLFRGVIRETGKIVEGHVEAASEDEGINVLSENGIITETIRPDPKPLNLSQELPASPEFADALESAFDSSSSQVSFDDLVDRYRGKRVWVIDRDKIRRRVAQVVDSALMLSHQKAESGEATRERVQEAIQGMFSDTKNIASERSAESIAGMRVTGEVPMPSRSASANGGAGASAAMEQQIARLAHVVRQAEAAMAAIAMAARRVGSGGGGPRRYVPQQGPDEERNEVLLEIFKTNLELQRGMDDPLAADLPPPDAVDPPPEPPAAGAN